jgi:hypothetical protein
MLIPTAMLLTSLQGSGAPPVKSPACAKADTVKMAPADQLQRLDDFRASLAETDRLRLDRALPRSANGGIARCDAVEGSRASCEASAYMPALRATGLMPRFLATICPKP